MSGLSCPSPSGTLSGAPGLREEAAWTPLDEEDERDQHEDLRQHGSGVGFEQLVDDTHRHPADERTPEVADPAKHHDHERIDDVRLPQVGTDVGELAERHAGDAG